MDNKNKDTIPDFDELTRAYAKSLNEVSFGGKKVSAGEKKEPVHDEEFSPTHEKIVDKIKEQNRILSKSIWTDEPVLKPQKSVWLDSEIENKTKSGEPEKESEVIVPITMEQRKKSAKSEVTLNLSQKPAQRKKPEQGEKKSFAVNIPNSYYKEYDKGAPVASRPLKREDLPKNRPVAPRPRTEQERRADEIKAAEYARQVHQNSLRAHGIVEEPQGMPRPVPNRSAQAQRTAQNSQRTARPDFPQPEKRLPTTSERMAGRRTTDTRKTLADYEKAIELEQKRKQEKASHAENVPKFKSYALEFNFVNAAVCVAAVFGVFLALLFMKRESGFINSENRNLAEYPSFSISSYFSGEYTNDITTFYTDTVPNRETFKKFCSNFSGMLGVKLNDTVIAGNMKVAEKEELDPDKIATTTTVGLFTGKVTTKKTESTSKKTTTTTEDDDKRVEVPENRDDGAWEGNVIVSGSGENVRAVGAYYGTFENGTYYAETINKWKEALGEQVNVYNMSIPTSAAYYMPSNLADTVSDQKDNIDNIAAGLKGIINVDVYNTLADHVDEYIYSRTDHHWQPLGAYYAATVFAQKAGLKEFPALKTYEKCQIEGFCGTMYGYSNNNQELANYPDTFTYYKPDNEYTVTYYDTAFQNGVENDLFFDYASGVNCYSAILNVDTEIAEIDTDSDSGRVLVVFKDSFGNALIPYFTHNFSKIYVCDFRYFDINAIDFCQQVGCTDLMFAISLTSCSTPDKVDMIDAIRVQ